MTASDVITVHNALKQNPPMLALMECLAGHNEPWQYFPSNTIKIIETPVLHRLVAYTREGTPKGYIKVGATREGHALISHSWPKSPAALAALGKYYQRRETKCLASQLAHGLLLTLNTQQTLAVHPSFLTAQILPLKL